MNCYDQARPLKLTNKQVYPGKAASYEAAFFY